MHSGMFNMQNLVTQVVKEEEGKRRMQNNFLKEGKNGEEEGKIKQQKKRTRRKGE